MKEDLLFGDRLNDRVFHPVCVEDVLEDEESKLTHQFHWLDEVVVVVLLCLKRIQSSYN
jgi:hypothetical protein